MTEHEFWRRDFVAVKRLRQKVIDSDSENSVGRSWSSIERMLSFGGIGNEVCLALRFIIRFPMNPNQGLAHVCVLFSKCFYIFLNSSSPITLHDVNYGSRL